MGRTFCYPIHSEKRTNIMNDMNIDIRQGIVGTHIATDIPVSIPFNGKQMQLALDKDPVTMNDSWDMVCDICVANGFIDPRDSIHIDHIVIDGVAKVFH